MRDHLVKVLWDDAEDAPNTWNTEEDIKKFGKSECLVESIGWIVSKTNKHTSIAGDKIQGDEITYGRVFKVPNKMIKKITEL